MKKMAVWMMVLCMVVGLTGCGSSVPDNETTPKQPAAVAADEEKAKDDSKPKRTLTPEQEKEYLYATGEEYTEESEKAEIAAAAGDEMPVEKPAQVEPVEFYEQSMEWTDPKGYTLKGTFALSTCWIADEDTELLAATWDKVANGKEMPNFGYSIKVGEVLLGIGGSYGVRCTDIAYAVGYFQITNKTDGFDITETNPVDVTFNLNANTPYIAMAIPWASKTAIYLPDDHLASSVIGNNNSGKCDMNSLFTEKDMEELQVTGLLRSSSGGVPGPHMTGNQTTKIPIIIALGMTSLPNHPEIMPDPDAVTLQFISWTFQPGDWMGDVVTCDFNLRKTWE